MRLTIIDMDSAPCPHCGRWVYVEAKDYHRNHSCPARMRLIVMRDLSGAAEKRPDRCERAAANFR